MRLHVILLGALISCTSSASSHLLPKARNVNNTLTVPQKRAQAVREAFEFAWYGYHTYAFPNDELLPVTDSFSNTRNGWGATAVDALSTAILMESQDVVTTIVDYIPTINFNVSKSNAPVSLFETTIRYLGGILSAVDLLNGPYQHLTKSANDTIALAQQAVNLASKLRFAFDTPTGIPSNDLNFGEESFDLSESTGLAVAGSLVLEWTRLSDLVHKIDYANLTQHAEDYLLNPTYQNATIQPLPGLRGTNIDLRTGDFLDVSGSWGGGDDSFYEYLIKMFVYDPANFTTYKDLWLEAVQSSASSDIFSHPYSRPDLTFLASWNGQDITLASGHLACFAGGNWILGGLVLGNQTLIELGQNLADSCAATYNATLTGIGPEAWEWEDENFFEDDDEEVDMFIEDNGFNITDASYNLRPEVLESLYYAYCATGDTKYQDLSWKAFRAINATCRTGSGFSSVSNVNAPHGGSFSNFQESYMFAETFKYAYLIQAEDAKVHVAKKGEEQTWVFNTEGHPFKVRAQQ
ncbi:glycoside hydrolase family 47 protein [Aureobasidium sp. EXF-12298]|nr:glycoside hydrolase family 47 protein [Aureobasidium sp. EXF-12298]KAI4765333.1 glycoside hydrolase family 47 protein [Aureobasidium sp. EXF-12344]KAI4783117.1 glycoside hydrolase family 47 protein [Aureobasidium sp. EXF-3400]